MPIEFAFVSFDAPAEATFGWSGCLNLSFEVKYTRYHCMLVAIHWRDPLLIVLQFVLLKT